MSKPLPKRGRSSLEWFGVLVFAASQTIPWLWVLAAFVGGFLLGIVAHEAEPLGRMQW
jgi:hypothetical protein